MEFVSFVHKSRSTQATTLDWCLPPPPGWIKPNFDGSFENQNGKVGIGGLIQGSTQAATPDWCLPPSPRWIKTNFDCSFNNQNGKAGIGGLIRDPFGKLLMGYTAKVHARRPLEADLLASSTKGGLPCQ